MSVQCERQPQCEHQQREYEFVMEGISTRMTMAMEKMADSNRMMSESNRRLCDALKVQCFAMIVVVVIVVLGFLADRQLQKNVDASEVVTNAGAESAQTVPEFGS